MTTEWADVPGLIQQGLYSDALGLLRRCIEAGAGDPSELRYWAGWCIECDPTGDKEAALTFYRLAAANRDDPVRRARSLYRAGWLLMHARRWDEAARTFEEIIVETGEPERLLDEQRDALYWHAGCLEALGCYLDALAGYRSCALRFPRIAPEARFREIVCLDHVGRFTEALATCDSFSDVPPESFDPGRYQELLAAVARERNLLARCLDESTRFPRAEGSA